MTEQPSHANGHTDAVGAERRKFPRRNIALDVAFGPVNGGKRPAEAQLDSTATINLSLGGVCLYTDVLYPIGTEIFCLLSLPGAPSRSR